MNNTSQLRWMTVSLLFVGLLVLLFLLDLFTSTSILSPAELLANDGPGATMLQNIFWEIRFPRVCTALLAGAGLALGGLLMQTFFQNPLAGPYVLGINTGAMLAVALVSFGIIGTASYSTYTLIGAGVVGAIAAFGILVLVSFRVQHFGTLLVLGLLLGYATGGIVSLFVQFGEAQTVQSYLVWVNGSFAAVTRGQLILFAIPLAVAFAVAWGLSRGLNALLLGSHAAHGLGISTRFYQYMILGITSLIAGIVTAFCGPISFIGVATPHICRPLLKTTNHRYLIPAVLCAGGCFGLFADWVSHLPWLNQVLPLNAITAVIGTPIVAWVLLKYDA